MEEASPANVEAGPARVSRALEQVSRHLGHLYEISKRLGGLERVEPTFAEVMEFATRAVPLRTALLLVGRDSGGEPQLERPLLTVWRAADVSAARLTVAAEQAASTYAWLVEVATVEPQHEAMEGLEGSGAWVLPEPPVRAEPAFVTLPLVSKGRVFGTLQVEAEGALAEEGLAFLDAVANQLAVSLDRHYALRREVRLREHAESLGRVQRALLVRERLAHLETEAAHRRQAFLAEASALLAASLDFRSSLPGLARLLVPTWADCCAIDLLQKEPGGQKDPVGAERIALMATEPPGAPSGSESFVARVLASHPWVAFPASPERMPEGHVSVERAEWTGLPSNLRLPIRVRGRMLGALSLISSQPGRYESTADLALFEALVQRIAATVETALLYQQAQEAVRWREELLAVVSHDMKAPLLVVRMNAEMLLKAARPPGEERRRHGRRHVEIILQAAEQMRNLIGGVLDRARMQGMPVPLAPQPYAVDALVQQSLEVLRPLALEKGQELKVEVGPELPRVLADRERFLQVLSNLVGNAIKFSPSGSTITLRARQVDGLVRLSVKDCGPGIPPEDVPHLFERFWRASGVNERGTGLGLSIARSIVEAHGGTLWVESRVGEGSTFFFTLPAARP